MAEDEVFPRDLSDAERALLLWVLPDSKLGYKEYREAVRLNRVVAKGRRGEGNYILASAETDPDTRSPLPPVIALGVRQEEHAAMSIVVRERLGDQVEFEIVRIEQREGGSWSLSDWIPGDPCPQCGDSVRTVEIRSTLSVKAALSVCPRDKRIWVHDCASGINHPIPHTNFYTDLMLVKNIRDPQRALDFRSFFIKLSDFTHEELTRAFLLYNQFKPRVFLGPEILADRRRSNWLSQLLHKLKQTQ
jgi:hypothetical protein